MAIELNHTIVPAHDKEKSARFYERIFGFAYQGPLGHFAPVRIPNQALTLDFDNRESFEPHHYAFKVSEAEFDGIFDRVTAEGLVYGSDPWTPDNMEINHWNGGRGVYFRDPNGHLLELLTRDYTAEQVRHRLTDPWLGGGMLSASRDGLAARRAYSESPSCVFGYGAPAGE